MMHAAQMHNMWKTIQSIISGALESHVDKLDSKNRELAHEFKNIQHRADILKRMVEQMRADGRNRNK